MAASTRIQLSSIATRRPHPKMCYTCGWSGTHLIHTSQDVQRAFFAHERSPPGGCSTMNAIALGYNSPPIMSICRPSLVPLGHVHEGTNRCELGGGTVGTFWETASSSLSTRSQLTNVVKCHVKCGAIVRSVYFLVHIN